TEDKKVVKGSNQKPEKPQSISNEECNGYYKMANQVADFIMSALRLIETGEFDKWDRVGMENLKFSVMGWNFSCYGESRRLRDKIILFVLRDRIEKKEFFNCSICQMITYNYKQTIVHLTECHQEFDVRSIYPYYL
ncbi:hypothetical protein PFISCL1PPCAC_2292, partial [Pristionchus fissidentatus]